MFESIAKAAGYRIPVNLARALELHSPELIDLNTDFCALDIVHQIPIYSFYEVHGAYHTKTLVSRLFQEQPLRCPSPFLSR